MTSSVSASPAQLLAELGDAVDGLARADVSVLSADELHRLVVGVQAVRDQLALAAADVQHAYVERGAWRADGSLRSSWAVGRDCRRDRQRVDAELRVARKVQHMPATRAALAAGRISWDHVELLARYATRDRWELFVDHEPLLVDQLAGCRLFDDARRIVQYWAQRADDQLDLHHDQPAPSTLYVSRGESGEGHLTGCLSTIDQEIVGAELDRLCRQLRHRDRADGIERTPAQRRAAALVEMAQRSSNATRLTARPLFQVIVGDDTARHLCQLASGHVVHPDDLAPFLDQATFETFLFDGPSRIISASQRRTFTGALRRAIQVRDRRCQHLSVCPIPATDAECDIDHRIPVSEGGPTDQFNAEAQCTGHNRIAHLHDPPQPAAPPNEPAGHAAQREPTISDLIRVRLHWSELRRPPHTDWLADTG